MVRAAVLLVAVLVSGSMACENVLRERVQEVNGRAADFSTTNLPGCTSKVGSFNNQHTREYKSVINKALRLAFEYMSISSHFGRDVIHRLGFQKLFRSESDARFEQAIDMIKYVTKRGANMYGDINFSVSTDAARMQPEPLPSLGLALNDGKSMYQEQAKLHRRALCLHGDETCVTDPDLAHQAQDAAGDEIGKVNDFAKKVNVLTNMYTVKERSIAEHLFDMHLSE